MPTVNNREHSVIIFKIEVSTLF